MIRFCIFTFSFFLTLFPLITFATSDPNEVEDTVEVNLEVILCDFDLICEPPLEDENNCSDCVTETPEATTTITTGAVQPPSSRNLTADFRLNDLSIAPDFSVVTLSWNTTLPVRTSVQIGKTTEYEDRIAAKTIPTTAHLFYFNRLDPGTVYFYEIRSVLSGGDTHVQVGSFVTKSETESSVFQQALLEAPSFLQAQLFKHEYIQLTWQNPAVPGFDYVRVMKKEGSIPSQSIHDGTLLYEGSATSVQDTAIEMDRVYTYTIFAHYSNDLFSRGTVVSMTTGSLNHVGEVVYGNEDFSLFDISITQNEQDLTWSKDTLTTDLLAPIVFRLKKELLFAPLEEVFLEAHIWQGNTFIRTDVYAMQFIPSRGVYEAVIAQIEAGQTVTFSVRKRETEQSVGGTITIAGDAQERSSEGEGMTLLQRLYPWPHILLVSLFALVLWVFRLFIVRIH